jgi:cellulose synthase operon protein C
VNSLLRNHKARDDQDLVEAEELVDELKQLQPDQLSTLILQVEVAHARNQLDKAVDLIQASATRSNLGPLTIKTLAESVEKLGRFDLADQLYRRYDALPNVRDGKIVLATFLVRRGLIKDALDLCEPLWANPSNAELAANTCIKLIGSANAPIDPRQLNRVTSWLEQAIKQKTDSAFLLVSLGNCFEWQERYDEAKTCYARVIKQGSDNAVASPDTNRLLSMSYNNFAWLLALKYNQGKDALENVDNAINLAGSLPDYLDTRGVIYSSLKRTKDAIKDLQSATNADPSPAKLFHLAQAYLQDHNKERAKYYLNSAREKKLDQLSYSLGGLHPLEQSAYRKVLSELGPP